MMGLWIAMDCQSQNCQLPPISSYRPGSPSSWDCQGCCPGKRPCYGGQWFVQLGCCSPGDDQQSKVSGRAFGDHKEYTLKKKHQNTIKLSRHVKNTTSEVQTFRKRTGKIPAPFSTRDDHSPRLRPAGPPCQPEISGPEMDPETEATIC